MNVIEWMYVQYACHKIWKINKKSDILPPNLKLLKYDFNLGMQSILNEYFYY